MLAAALLAGCGGDGESGPSDEELDAIVAEIDKDAPNVGLGEGSPPPAASGWATDLSQALVPLDEFQEGGPGKDGIPAIDDPAFETALAVDWLADREPVIAVTVDGETRGYPIQVLIWHEIANDVVQGTPVAVTFCPLCNTAIVFDRRLDGETLDFGVSGKLRDSDLVMFDRQTESWWQQFSGQALVGTHAGAKLEKLPARIVSWQEFRATYPESKVLSRDTGSDRAYGQNPYAGYDDVDSPPWFDARNAGDDRLPPKERVVFLELGDEALAVPTSLLAARKLVTADVAGRRVEVRWRPGVASALSKASIAEGRDVGAAEVAVDGAPWPFSEPFWFAVAAFREDVRVVTG